MDLRRVAMVRVVAGFLAVSGCAARAGGGDIVVGGGGTDSGVTSTDDASSMGVDTGSTTTCRAPRTVCNGQCVSLQTNNANCGGCNTPCDTGQTCVAGVCTTGSTGCTAPQVMCGTTCTDVTSDTSNCGACGSPCNAGQACTGGVCTGGTSTCAAPRMMCGSTCTDITSDASNCGVCGLPCGSGQRCVSGSCTAGSTCSAPRQVCSGACVSVTSDPSNCGACGRRCAAGQSCAGGTCTTGGGGTTYAGARCTSDAQCGPSLMCDTSVAGGYCTATCTESGSGEASECGGGAATCLSQTDDGTATPFCAASCTPGASTCRSGMVCTGFWYSHMTTGDAPGCVPHCASNADCPSATPQCNVRTGACGTTPAVLSRLPDGSPCDPSRTVPDAMGNPVNVQCRGICFRVGTGTTQGICGSFLNIATGTMCPDNPAAIQPRGPMGDELAICIFASCTSTAGCPSGLTCRVPTGGTEMLCTYP